VAPDFCDMVSVHVTVMALPDGPPRALTLAWTPTNAYSEGSRRIASTEIELVAPAEDSSERLAALTRAQEQRRAGDLANALATIEAAESRFGEDTSDALRLEHADLLRDMGRLAEAREFLERWWISARPDPGPRSLMMAQASRILGLVMRDQGDLAGARRLIEQSLELQVEAEGHEPTSTAAASSIAIKLIRLLPDNRIHSLHQSAGPNAIG
jgi:tetratricopeptide (TPR) repeat protein